MTIDHKRIKREDIVYGSAFGGVLRYLLSSRKATAPQILVRFISLGMFLLFLLVYTVGRPLGSKVLFCF